MRSALLDIAVRAVALVVVALVISFWSFREGKKLGLEQANVAWRTAISAEIDKQLAARPTETAGGE